MTIDWNHFTPWSALAGGVLIGASAAMFVLLNGRIAGVAGIVGGLLRPVRAETGWRLAFVAGLMAAPLLWQAVAPLPATRVDAGYGLVALAGLLVGVGTRYGAGCTSGHEGRGGGQRARRQPRQAAHAMATGLATVYVVRHLVGA
jgi:uncharacterized protein